ncbi:HNH endonuclease [candidate division KSB1 bacterium]|nr:HNH endonuclease [candidate division KSB1 bacterium]
MTIKAVVREQIRQRANFACEFCGISEIDAGGELTIDHFQPKSKDGDDSLDNLIYCCVCCNQFKHDHWSTNPQVPQLWNPRRGPATEHFFERIDGMLQPLTEVGAFTLSCLRLNRRPLVAHRLLKRQEDEKSRLLTYYRERLRVREQLLAHQAEVINDQQKRFEEQWRILQFFRGTKE